MKIYLFVVLTFVSFMSQSQLKLSSLRTSKAKVKMNPTTIPFFDDFSSSGNTPDTLLWEAGSSVFINATMADAPPTYKVATFDGLNAFGQAYTITDETGILTDSLVSQPIDLSTANIDSTWISFYWQAKGNGEAPDDEDFLQLLIKDEAGQWDTLWTMPAQEIEDFNFHQVNRPINQEKYLHGSFQFKFRTYGSGSGPFDTWNIDYIYLNDGRSLNDLNYFDRALTGSPSPLFGKYTQIPFAHLINNDSITLSPQLILASNLSGSNFLTPCRYIIENTRQNVEYHNEFISGVSFNGLPNAYDIDSITSPSVRVALDAFDNQLDSQYITSTFILFTEDEEPQNDPTPGINLEVNDTVQVNYLLEHQYAYDDGVAEFAAGINSNGGMLAVRYIIETKDTLNHVRIHFPDIMPDSDGENISIKIWGSSLEKEITSQTYTISKALGLNTFTEIALINPLIVSDTFHIGFEQSVDAFIGIGFDRNNTEAKGEIFSNTSGEWVRNEQLEGALMIRPVFKKDTSVILSQPAPVLESPKIYPNPANGFVNTEGSYDELEILSLSGKRVYHSYNKKSHNIKSLKNGLFLVIIIKDNNIFTHKLIIEHDR